ncbi:MAG: hypothetical protein K0S65_3963 [Labilithrix sp.]|nr:hypothetical protein [Labilithrix sp.]
MTSKQLGSSFFGLLFLVACSGTTEPSANNAGDDDTQRTRTALGFIAPCTATACGEVPPSSKAANPECKPAAGSCAWADPNGTTSYRPCEESQCGAKPDESVCPAGTTFKGAACGSENEGACIWRSSCASPRSTTPCPDTNGCGDAMPDIGVICKDGSTGGLACMHVGAKCAWQPTCD